MSTVFMIQETWMEKIDLSSAAQFGKLTPILRRDASVSMNYYNALRALEDSLSTYKEGDHIMAAPCDPAAVLLAGAALERLGIAAEGFSWLRFERNRVEGSRDGTGFYLPGHIRYPMPEDDQ